MLSQDAPNINGDRAKIPPPPPKDDYVRLAELDMSEREFSKKYPHIIIYGPADDPYVSTSEFGEGDHA